MPLPTHLEAAGVRIPLGHGGIGPQIQADPPFESLGWVTTMWITGKLPDLLEKVQRGEDAEIEGFAAIRPRYPLEAHELS